MIPFELVVKSDRVLSDWDLQARERRNLVVMLVVLFKVGDFLRARDSVIFPTDEKDVYYAKVTGNQQLRPRCSLGKNRPADETDFLLRATKKGGVTWPLNADEKALRLRAELHSGALSRIRYRPMLPPPNRPEAS